jgi:hypothetical protein
MALLTLLCGRCGSERQLAPPTPAPSEHLADREVRSLIAFRFGDERRRRG